MLSSMPTPMTQKSVTVSSRLKTRVLSVADIRCIVEHMGLDALMDEMIARLSQAFEQFDPTETIVPVRTGFNYHQPHVGLVEWMPLFQKYRQIVVKAVGYHPENPIQHALPTVLSTVSAYDPASGHLAAVMDGTFLTALRTGAASAIATRHLAKPDSCILGLIGAGAQAVTQLHALSRCFDLDQVLVFDSDPATTRSFAERVACLQLDPLTIRPATVSEIVSTADILCTATSVEVGSGPVFTDQTIQPWLHINAVGADFPGKFEIPLSLLERGFVCPDFYEQAVLEGECQRLKDPRLIAPELYQVVQAPAQYRSYQGQLTVFDSTGFALEDQVALNMLLDYATELEVGTWIALESAFAEVKNPYSFITDAPAQSPSSKPLCSPLASGTGGLPMA